MSEAIQAYHSITATDEFKNLEWMRRMTAHNEATALGHARRQEAAKWQGVTDALAEERDAALAENERLRVRLAICMSIPVYIRAGAPFPKMTSSYFRINYLQNQTRQRLEKRKHSQDAKKHRLQAAYFQLVF